MVAEGDARLQKQQGTTMLVDPSEQLFGIGEVVQQAVAIHNVGRLTRKRLDVVQISLNGAADLSRPELVLLQILFVDLDVFFSAFDAHNVAAAIQKKGCVIAYARTEFQDRLLIQIQIEAGEMLLPARVVSMILESMKERSGVGLGHRSECVE